MGSKLTQYPCLNMRYGSTFSVQQYLQRQAFLLHGEEARTLAYMPKILHVLCGMLTALTRGEPNAPEVQRELEQRVTILALRKAVRDTLSKRNLTALMERRGSCRKFSRKSWDEPFGFMERKREILLNKRSYSESDLSKITIIEVRANKQCIICDTVKHNFKQSFKQDFTPYSTQFDGHGQVCNGEIHQSRDPKMTDSQQKSVPCNGLNEKHGTIPPPETVNKKTKHTVKKSQAFVKFSSNVEVSLKEIT